MSEKSTTHNERGFDFLLFFFISYASKTNKNKNIHMETSGVCVKLLKLYTNIL